MTGLKVGNRSASVRVVDRTGIYVPDLIRLDSNAGYWTFDDGATILWDIGNTQEALTTNKRTFATTIDGRDIYVYAGSNVSTTATVATATAAAGVPTVTGAIEPWYRREGAPAPLAAYRAKGVADLATSYINLVTPGTYNLTSTAAPAFDTATGWTFNGSDDYLASLASSSSKPVTMIARVNCTDHNNYRTILGCSGSAAAHWYIHQSTGKMRLTSGGTAVIANSDNILPLGAVHTVAASYSATGVCIMYVDGVPDGTATNDVTFTARTLEIGRSEGAFYYWLGTIESLAIYTAVLSDVQIAAIGTAMAAL